MNFDKEKLINDIKKLRNASVLVVGDLAIDQMVYGDAERISREAPVLILQHTQTKIILGGASNAAHNVSTLNNGKVGVIGVCGEDYQSEQMKDAFKAANIDTKYLIPDKNRKTITKTRISGSITTSITQQIVRIDRQTSTPIEGITEQKVIEALEKAIPQYDAVVLSDYKIGTLTQKVVDKAIELAHKYNKVIVVDPQNKLERFKGVTSMTPNLPDTQCSVGFLIETEEDLKRAGTKLLNETGAESILITCGADGMFVTERGEKYTKIPVFNKSEVFDVTGAGDTVTARAEVAGLDPEKGIVTMTWECYDQHRELLMQGEAKVRLAAFGKEEEA